METSAREAPSTASRSPSPVGTGEELSRAASLLPRRAHFGGGGPRSGGGGVAAALAIAAFANPALAHEGHHERLPVADALRHLLSGPDHLLALAALVVLVAVGTWSWRRLNARR